jgi:hypothetical protein
MRRILGFALSSILFSATGMAAQDSQTSYLAAAARAGSIELHRGIRYQASNRIAHLCEHSTVIASVLDVFCDFQR